jgi:3-hydroxyacyl-CoA dehydrogenase/enoyl-CoA hydratase/3-hydroxybutyryl-CoA epimerase
MDDDPDGIVWLTLDRADKSANTLNREVLKELAKILDGLAGSHRKGLVIRSGKESGFIAGADVNEFTGLTDPTVALAAVERGQEVLARIERLPFPTLALIRGFCLGGGLELALACRYRIAADIPQTRLGLPEVRLGIHPGFGGTVRLPRLIGPVAALELLLTGRTVDARKGARLGLVDLAVPERQLERAARITLLRPPPPRRPPLWQRLLNAPPARHLLARQMRRRTAGRISPEHYPAPFAIIELWRRFGCNPATQIREEARSVARLVTGEASRNLVRIFFLGERLKSLGRSDLPPSRFVHVIGGGTMGGAIAAWCALQGMQVTVEELDSARLGQVAKRAAGLFAKRLRRPREIEAALDRLIPDPGGYGIGRADVVIEAIFEDAAAKRELYRRIEPRLRADALLATNTSSIPLEELGDALAEPGRLVGLHFFNPVEQMELVEVVAGTGTDQEAAVRAAAFVRGIGKLPLPVRSSPGFLVNRILMPYLLEAVIMEAEGIPPAQIDRAAEAFGMPMGPLLLADLVGLDVCLSVASILAGHYGFEVPKRLGELVAAGSLGRKSGRGFYVYRGDKPAGRGTGGEGARREVTDRLVLRLLNEAVACLRERVAADADLVDAGVVYGTGFAPFRGGPLHYLHGEGILQLLGRLETLAVRHGDRFTPDAGWRDILEERP